MAVPNKSELVGTRVTPARKTAYVEAAQREGVRVSEWIRRQLDRRVAEIALHEAEGPQLAPRRMPAA